MNKTKIKKILMTGIIITFTISFLTCATSLVVKNGIEDIPEKAYLNKNLESLTLPSTVKSIGEYAFSQCGLKKLILPEGLKTIGANAFSGNRIIGELIIPETVTDIGESAFSNNKYIRSVIFSPLITNIPQKLFYDNLIEGLVIPSNVKIIGNSAFRDNKLKILSIPEGVTTIENYAFFNNSLETVNIPESVLSIEQFAFDLSVKLIGNSKFINMNKGFFSIEIYFRNYPSGSNNYVSVSVNNGPRNRNGDTFGGVADPVKDTIFNFYNIGGGWTDFPIMYPCRNDNEYRIRVDTTFASYNEIIFDIYNKTTKTGHVYKYFYGEGEGKLIETLVNMQVNTGNYQTQRNFRREVYQF